MSGSRPSRRFSTSMWLRPMKVWGGCYGIVVACIVPTLVTPYPILPPLPSSSCRDDRILRTFLLDLGDKLFASMGACRNSFLGVFFLFLARIAFQSSFFSESRSFTRPLFWFFVPDLDRLAGQPIQIFFVFSFCSRSGSRFFRLST